MTEMELALACLKYETVSGQKPVRITLHPADHNSLVADIQQQRKYVGAGDYMIAGDYPLHIETDRRVPIGTAYIASEPFDVIPGDAIS